MPATPQDKVYSISQINRKIRSLLEFEIGEVWVEGEVSNLRKQASGHQYFTLKDEGAQLSCVLFRGHSRQVRFELEDGQQVQAFGDVSVYEARGQYQLIVRHMQSRGAGALQAKFEALKSKLAAEGLFDSDAKTPVPSFPRVLALVTSPTGAALRDMLNILARRAPWVRVLIYPVRVQGKGAEAEIAQAISNLNDLSGTHIPEVDTIVTGRGGGSIEDLWCFNEEIVARAIHASRIPVVSAVGHEIDFTIADFAADLRAPTPSAAAELIVPDKTELQRHLQKLRAGMHQIVSGTLQHHARILDLISRSSLTREPQRVLMENRQRLDYVAQELDETVHDRVNQHRTRIDHAARVLQVFRPGRALEEFDERLKATGMRLQTAAERALREHTRRMDSVADLLRNLGPDATFARGFTLTLDENGRNITDAAQVKPGQRILTRLAKGEIKSEVME